MIPVWLSAGLDDVPTSDDWLDPALRARLAAMQFPKRWSEARLGRWAAKRAVARVLGLDPDDYSDLRRIVVSNAVDGAPEVHIGTDPAAVTIAMTDRADWAVCALVPRPMRVGCDLELVEWRSDGFIDDYLTERERAAVLAHPDRDLAANLMWSAKESALKVLRTGLRRDTRSVEVDFDAAGADGWKALSVRRAEGGHLPGWWIRFGAFVLTVVASDPSEPPKSLDRPPAIASATPTHRWMESLPVRGG